MRDLTVRYGTVTALDKVNIKVPAGTVVGLVGPNGAGKSTLVDAIAGFLYRYDGSILLNPPAGGEPTMWLQTGAAAKAGKLRCHVDLRTTDVVAEVDRLLNLGATRADVGQRGDEAFEVLADPEGNEFCVLHRADPP